jgi:topoisomerase-4 subunit B
MNDVFGPAPRKASATPPRKPPATEQSPTPKPAPPQMPDSSGYSAKDIEVLEGLEPVRRRPA